ncbi:hypothetical protein HHI36_004724 [Cryptolaemus montrouzieri]|uniref:Spaetzle domain-containing protein n=1 Tax=Cryptolaemus montrouzieri TaxID=559131 RepID=A0ABD2NSU0_9CUCU
MFLAKQARFNHETLVIDETRDTFSSTIGPYPAAKYSNSYKDIDITTSLPIQRSHQQWQNGEKVFLNVNTATNFSGNLFDVSSYKDRNVPPSGSQFLTYKYTSNIPHPKQFRDIPRFFGQSSHFRTNFVWKRDVNRFARMHDRVKRSELLKRHMREIRESPYKKNFTGEVLYKRNKRQNGLDDSSLCQTRSNFIMPRAALNKNGVWMYVVNMEDNNQKYTQLVRSEVCASQTCSSLCGLPNGYTSRCEQKYIQKRLIALQGQGDQLYTDIFWIPSCCVCTIQRN